MGVVIIGDDRIEMKTKREITISRTTGANIKISTQSNAYAFIFVISNVRLDWNIFDIKSWFLKKVGEIGGSYIFCFRQDYKKVEKKFLLSKQLRQCLEVFARISLPATLKGATISCYNKKGGVYLTLPNIEWWQLYGLEDDFEEIKKWYLSYFSGVGVGWVEERNPTS